MRKASPGAACRSSSAPTARRCAAGAANSAANAPGCDGTSDACGRYRQPESERDLVKTPLPGLDGRLGSLEVGKLADLIGVRTDHARQVPIYDPVSHLVYTAHGDDVVWSVVNGQVLMRDGVVRTLDEARVLDEARAAARQVRQAVQ